MKIQIKVIDNDTKSVLFNDIYIYNFNNIEDIRDYGFLCADLQEENPGCILSIKEIKEI